MFKFLFAALLISAYLVSARKPRRPHFQRALGSSVCEIHSEVAALITKGSCRPVNQPVPVPIPEGFISVTPSVVLLPKCEGMACSSPLSCKPLPYLIKNISISVYAYTEDRQRVCTSVPVESHEGCMCECPTTCPHNQVPRRGRDCGCECDREQQAVCEGRGRLWDPSTCSCLCPLSQEPRCSSGQVYIKELCRCENY